MINKQRKYIKDNFKMVRNMDKAFKSGRIIQSMMGTGKIIRCADTAHMCGVMGTSIKANGLKIR